MSDKMSTVEQVRPRAQGVALDGAGDEAALLAASARATEHEQPAPDIRRTMSRDAIARRSLIVADLLAAVAAFALTIAVLGPDTLHASSIALAPLVVICAKLTGLYDRDELLLRKTTLDEMPSIFQLATLMTLCSVVGQRVFVHGPFGGDQVLALWALLFALILGARAAARLIARHATTSERVLVIGHPRETAGIAERLSGAHDVNADVVATLDLDLNGDHRRTAELIGRAIRLHRAERVVLAPSTADTDAVLDALRYVKSLGIKVALRPRLFEVVGSSVQFDDVEGLTLLSVPRFGLTRSSAAVKRALDVTAAGLGLLAILPAFVLIALLVRFDGTGGPVFFRQRRVGRNGRHFGMLKFRTMVPNAEQLKDQLRHQNETEGLFKIADDPRITRIGNRLRSSSLDELPQLLNVLRGDMSLVGPRPLVVDEDELVEGWHRRRLHLTPGMTGPWQVLGGAKVPLQEMVKIDYLYIANWTMWNDVKILLRTAGHVFGRRGL